MTGNLYIVSTPIGNMADISYRAVTVLNEVDLILAEDTRVSLKLLNHYKISKPLVSCHKFNEKARSIILSKILTHNHNLALISDAGTPLISDPGYEIIKAALNLNINPIIIPGPVALIAAISISGFRAEKFVFLGFLPKKNSQALSLLSKFTDTGLPIIIYIPTNKVIDTLEMIKAHLGNVMACLAKEITKIHETYFRGSINDILLSLNEENVRGEFVLVIQPDTLNNNDNSQNIDQFINMARNENLSPKTILNMLMALFPQACKNGLYQKILDFDID